MTPGTCAAGTLPTEPRSILASPVAEVPRGERGYGWPSIPEQLARLPVFLVDLDGTLRGDVVPMVKLAGPLVPDYLGKLTRRQPVNAYKVLHFLWSLVKLWTLRKVFHEHRRRYKHLFSELHHLAAAMLLNTGLDEARAKYRSRLTHYVGLWSDGAVALLRRLTDRGVVVLVTGSEQLQTEECVRLLASSGVRIDRIFVRGSLYGFDAEQHRFTGSVRQLNVTLDGKRDAVDSLGKTPGLRIVGAVGNSRPDRALFEAVIPGGICVLVCPESVVRGRKRSTFVIRKLQRNGFRLVWDASAYVALVDDFGSAGGQVDRPILVADNTFRAMLEDDAVRPLLERLLASPARAEISPVRLTRAG